MKSISKELLLQLPKVELHCHLDGSLRVSSILDQAKIDNIKLPLKNYDDLTAYFKIGENRGSLEDYIRRFDIALSVMQTPKALSRFAYELIEDVSKENVRYIEVRYSPILHTKKGMALEEALESVRKGLKRGEKDFGVKSGIIVCGIRHISPDASLKLADLAVRYKNRGVVGFDLAGSEENFPAKEHREAFYLIRNNNVNATKVIYIAKIKTSVQLLTIFIYLIGLAFNKMLLIIFGDIFMIISVLVTMYTGYIYTVNTFQKLK